MSHFRVLRIRKPPKRQAEPLGRPGHGMAGRGREAAELQKEINAANLASGGNVMESDMVRCRWAKKRSALFTASGCLCPEARTAAGPSTKRHPWALLADPRPCCCLRFSGG